MEEYQEIPQEIPPHYMPQTLVAPNEIMNAIETQLNMSKELQLCEHLLRGDIPVINQEGNTIWEKPDEKKRILNEEGVHEIIRLLSLYLNKNILLGNYDKEEVYWHTLDFSDKLINLIYMKRKAFGLDTKEKIKRYEIIVGEIVDQVHGAYKRAENGEERKSIRQMISLVQTQNMNPEGNQPHHSKGMFKKMFG